MVFLQPTSTEPGAAQSPYSVTDAADYARWRACKLAGYPLEVQSLLVEIRDPLRLTRAEMGALLERYRKTNMAIYAVTGPAATDPRAAVRAIGTTFGLTNLDHNLCADEDGIASLQVVPEGRHREYIPYSNRPINWHTDGYYNTPENRIRAFVLHCVSQAASGGANRLLDPEIAYMLLRDEDPAYVAALMQPGAMTIPANVEGGDMLRQAQSGPVFSVDPNDGSLHMRYTARTRSIQWRGDEITREAVAFLAALLRSRIPYIYEHRLEPGQGLLCNNVLHTREGFQDAPEPDRRRLYLRARYRDRLARTSPDPVSS